MQALRDKYAAFGLLVGAGALLILASMLRPAACGYGTHTQLGLPPCNFLMLTHFPCPSCGMTTSFTYATHAQFRAALLASPFGLLAFFGTIATIPTAVFMVLRGTPIHRITEGIHFSKALYVTFMLYFLSWIFKVAEIKLSN